MIGIDISDKSIKIAEVSGRGTSHLRTVCWSPLSPNILRRGVVQDVALAAEAIREAFQKCSPFPVEGNVVVASIPETQSFVRVIDLPVMADSEMNEAVQWAVRQHIPFDLDRVYLDWQPLPRLAIDPNRRSVLVGAVQKDVVDPLLASLDGAGLKVAALELEAQAIVRSVLPRDSESVRGVLIVDLGATSTNIVFFDEGVMRFTTSIQLGGDDLTQKLAASLHVLPGEAAEKKVGLGADGQQQDPNTVLAMREAVMDLIGRVDRVVREMSAQFGQNRPLQAILLTGGSANLAGITNAFAEVFPNIPVQIGSPWTNLYADSQNQNFPLSQADASHFVTALGLALRQIEYT